MPRLKHTALAALILAPLAILLWQTYAPPPTTTFTDGLGITLTSNQTTTRTVVWTDPVPSGSTPDDFAVTPDGNTRIFSAERLGGQGGLDLYRSNRAPDGSWSEPKNLGLSVNTTADEHSPAFSPSANRLYFTSDRSGNADIYASGLDPDLKPSASAPVPTINSPHHDLSPTIAPRGDFLYFSSNRPGHFDLYRARLLHGEILPPENLGAPLNTPADETHPLPSADGLSLTFKTTAGFVTSTSREVTTIPGPNPLLATLAQHGRWIALSLGALIIAIFILRRYFGRSASLTEKCLAGSVALHLALLFLFATWKFTAHVLEIEPKEKIEVALNSDNLAEEKLALDIRETVAVLPEVQVQTAPTLTSPPDPPPTDTLSAIATPPHPQTPTDLAFATPAPAPAAITFTPTTPALPNLPSPTLTPSPPTPTPLHLEAPPDQRTPQPTAPLATLTAPPSPPLPSTPTLTPNLHLPAPDLRSPAPDLRLPASDLRSPAPDLRPPTPDFTPPPADLPTIAATSTRDTAIPSPPPAPLLLQQPTPSPTPAPQTTLASLQPASLSPAPLALPTTTPSPTIQPPPSPRPANLPSPTPQRRLPTPDLRSPTPDIRPPTPDLRPPAPDLPPPALALESPEPIDNPFLLRDPDVRARVIEQLGGSADTEKAIRASLDWLTRHQENDGRWAIRRHGGRDGHDVAATSFALLCYMGWGATHQGDSPHRDTVARALDWLLSKVDPETGDARDNSGDMYDQGVAAITLAEAYALTADPKIRPPLEAAIRFIVAAQSDRSGGWRYQPGDHNADTSVVGWQLLALASARSAGIDVPQSAFDGTRRWLDNVGGGPHGGLYGYQNRSPKPAMVAEAMFCQQLLDLPPTHPRMAESAGYVAANLKDARDTNYYYWYYGALAMFQHGGGHWQSWNDTLTPVLLATQQQDGNNAGSWNPAGHHGTDAGRAVVTAMATLTLEVYYRYLPMYNSPTTR